MSNTQLEKLLVDEPPEVREAILDINTDATNLALQVALLVPILAGLLGLFNSLAHDAPAGRRALGRRRGRGARLTGDPPGSASAEAALRLKRPELDSNQRPTP